MKKSNEPNYFIVGAAKAGTNTLAYYLTEHPEAYIVPQKEVNFFSNEEIRKQKLYYKGDFIVDNEVDYLNLFAGTENYKVRGEGSVSYLFYESVPKKIKRKYPDAKIIILLRNPIKRAHSHYLMDYRIGLVKEKFVDIIATGDIGNIYYQQYVGLSLYYDQVKRYMQEFGEANVMVILFEDFIKDTQKMMKEVCRFLQIDENFEFIPDVIQNDFKVPNNSLIKTLYSNHYTRKFFAAVFPASLQDKIVSKFFSKQKPVLLPEEKQLLSSIFREDVSKLAKIINRNLDVWTIK